MSTDVLLMTSPRSSGTFETSIGSSPVLPEKQPSRTAPQALKTTTTSSSRASTPLSSVMDVDNVSTEPSSPPTAQPSVVKTDPAAKKKLTFAEKEVLRIEKQFKDQQKAEEKVRKERQREAEKRAREEKKRAEAEEKEAKRREKETEKAQKRREQDDAKEEKRKAKEEKEAVKQAEVAARDAEKRARVEEKAKKDRSQLRLNAFFAKKDISGSATSSRRNSIASNLEDSPPKKDIETALKTQDEPSDYAKAFPPFFLHTHTTMAPPTYFECDQARLTGIRKKLDSCLESQLAQPPSLKRTFEEASHEPAAKRRKLGKNITLLKNLISQVNKEPETSQPIRQVATSAAKYILSSVPLKYLRYAEDIRPPYIGTYTKQPISCSTQRLCRNPFTRALPGVNYDYDSEAEWEEPEEGDDCASDEEDSEVDSDDEDMAGFLDDEDDAPKRRNVMGDMEPLSTDVFWQDDRHSRGVVDVRYGNSMLDINLFRIAPLHTEATGSIDPFSVSYWKAPEPARSLPDPTTMAPPPRMPLNPLLGSNSRLAADPSIGLTLKPPPTAVFTAAGPAPPKPKTNAKPFPSEYLDEFKREISGSDLSKVGLVEVLKKKFPQVTGKTIQETLPLVAKRDGKNQAEKKWVLL